MTTNPTVLQASSAEQLEQDIKTVDGGSSSSSYIISISADISLATLSTKDLSSLDSASQVTISGNGHTLDGAGLTRGFFVLSGNVSINDLTIQNTVAKGGAGGESDASGGGGAGLGGGLFVGGSANVALDDVNFRDTSAIGGAGGTAQSPWSTSDQDGIGGGGGGGLGGAGGQGGIDNSGGGGGGIGSTATGGNNRDGAGGAGLVQGQYAQLLPWLYAAGSGTSIDEQTKTYILLGGVIPAGYLLSDFVDGGAPAAPTAAAAAAAPRLAPCWMGFPAKAAAAAAFSERRRRPSCRPPRRSAA